MRRNSRGTGLYFCIHFIISRGLHTLEQRMLIRIMCLQTVKAAKETLVTHQVASRLWRKLILTIHFFRISLIRFPIRNNGMKDKEREREKEKEGRARKWLSRSENALLALGSSVVVAVECFEIPMASKYGCLLVISTRSSCGQRYLSVVFPSIPRCSESYSGGTIKAKRQRLYYVRGRERDNYDLRARSSLSIPSRNQLQRRKCTAIARRAS